MHEYIAKDVTTCLESRRVVFIGDSVTRQIFWAFAKKLDFQEQGEEKHANITVDAHGLRIEFVWDPYLNTSTFDREVAVASSSGSNDEQNNAAAILLLGGGLWNVRYLGEASYQHFESSIVGITRALHNSNIPVAPFGRLGRSSEGVHDLFVIAPIQVPHYDVLSPERARTITPARVKAVFQHLQQVSVQHNIRVAWSFSHMTWHEPRTYHEDGLHVSETVAAEMADVLLNIRCNAILRQTNSKGYPMDKTCCNRYPKPNWTQAAILIMSMGLLPSLIPITFNSESVAELKEFSFLPSRNITKAITVLILAICYCYYADRTQLFNKSQKQYSFVEFTWLCTAILFLGVFSMRRSVPAPLPNESGRSIQKLQDKSFLSRNQTEEWKGWMQFIILIYHYTGASKVLFIYKMVRLLVASYIFMTGFGHTVYFYQRADYSLRRSAAVLIRINMLSCLLPYMMETDYLFYYFAPMISFWYLIIYLTMAVGRSRNYSPAFLITKITISAISTTALIRVPTIFGTLFQILEKCFNIHWNVTEWRFRLQLDSCIVYTGMLCGIVFVKLMDALNEEVPEHCSVNRLIRRVPRVFRFGWLAMATLTCFGFYLFARRAPDKYAYNAWFPYISTAPILAYVIFRNASRQTRSFHSSIFAWMGRHSLETFTLQFHIWLAADTKGLLALGIFERIIGEGGGRRVDSAIVTIIFLWVCWHVAAATQTLTNWIVDPSEVKRNLEPDYGVTSVKEGFSRMEGEEDDGGGIFRCHVEDGISARATRSASRMKWLVGGLRARIGIILGVMWLLNLVNKS